MSHIKRLAVFCVLIVLVPHANATVWGVKSLAPGGAPSSAPAHLFRFEENLAGGVTDLGPIALATGQPLDVDGMAISPVHGLLAYALDASGSQLVSVDTSTAVATPIGAILSGRDIRGATFVGNDLFVVDAASDELIEIDPTSGAIVGAPVLLTLGGPVYDVSTGADLALSNTGDLYLISFSEFLLVAPSTGVLTSVFLDTTPDGSCGANPQFLIGATFSDSAPAGTLFAFEANCTDDLFDYDVTGGFARTSLIPDILASFNAGRGDLAALVEPPDVPVRSPQSLLALAAAFALLLTLLSRRSAGQSRA